MMAGIIQMDGSYIGCSAYDRPNVWKPDIIGQTNKCIYNCRFSLNIIDLIDDLSLIEPVELELRELFYFL